MFVNNIERQYLIYDDTEGFHHPQYSTENPGEGSYSSSDFSHISSSPMDYTSNKMDENSSTCSSNNTDNVLDSVRLPKPPPNPRKQRRQVATTTPVKPPSEIFEFSDDSSSETTSAIKEPNSNAQALSSGHINEKTDPNLVSSETQDRYQALRNVFINDNNPFSTFLKQPTAKEATNNWILSTYSTLWHEASPTNSVKSDISPFNNSFQGNDKAQLLTTQGQFDKTGDKYAAVSQEDLKERGQNWRRTVMEVGTFGWSDRLLSGNCDQSQA